MTSALRVGNLSVRYASRKQEGEKAVDEVSFGIEPGQCLGLVGESGSGKSTVGLAVQGLLTAQRGVKGVEAQGEIEIAGTPLDPSDEAGWRGVRGHRVTTVFQDPMSSLDPTMTIGRLLGLVTGSRRRAPAGWKRWRSVNRPRCCEVSRISSPAGCASG